MTMRTCHPDLKTVTPDLIRGPFPLPGLYQATKWIPAFTGMTRVNTN